MISHTSRALVVVLALNYVGLEAGADSGEQSTDVRKETTRLIIQDMKSQPAAKAAAPPVLPSAEASVIMLSPFIVRERASPQIKPAPYETPVMRLLKTGDVFVHVGRKTTESAFLSGVNAPGGFGRPELSFRLSW